MAKTKTESKVKTKVISRPKRKKVDTTTRVNKIKQVQKAETRKKFKAAEYISQMELAYKEYEAMLIELDIAKVKKIKHITDRSRKEIHTLNMQIDIIKIRLDIIKSKIDLNLRRLKFCLPELKAVELANSDGSSPFTAFAAAVEAMSKS